MEEGRAPTGGKLIKADVFLASLRVGGESLIKRVPCKAVRESGGIHEGEIDPLAKLRAEGVSGIAKDRDSGAVPLMHANIVVDRSGKLIVVLDLIEKGFGLRHEVEEVLLPAREGLSFPLLNLIETDAPEEAEEIVFSAGGKESGQLAGAADALPEGVGIEIRRALADEPERPPRIAVDAGGHSTGGAQGGLRSVANEEEIKGRGLFASFASEEVAPRLVL